MEHLRSAVRPVVTFAFVLAQIALAAAWAMGLADAKEAFAALAVFTGMIVRDYFNSREQQQGDPAGPAGQK